jgi:hypothetical protein
MQAADTKTLILSSALLVGCTTTSLDRNLLAQGGALNDVQEEMVLSNLELFRQRPHPLPWHLKITGGSVTVNDTVSPTFSYVWPPVSRTLGIAPSRSVQLQWNIVPVTDSGELLALSGVYESNVVDKAAPAEANLLPPTCPDDNGSFRYFSQTFDEGRTPPAGRPHGYFNGMFTWVKDDPKAEECFDLIVRAILDAAPVSAQDRGLMVPTGAERPISR